MTEPRSRDGSGLALVFAFAGGIAGGIGIGGGFTMRPTPGSPTYLESVEHIVRPDRPVILDANQGGEWVEAHISHVETCTYVRVSRRRP